MGNVLDPSKQQQVLALGRLGWSLRRIEQETGIRRETAGAYLRAAGIAVRGRGRPGGEETPKPAISPGEVSTDPARPWPPPGRAPCASACEPYRELIVDVLPNPPPSGLAELRNVLVQQLKQARDRETRDARSREAQQMREARELRKQ